MAGLSQCIYLPGPGNYRLNGWGRVVPSSNPPLTSNRASLLWEVRYDGDSENCALGTPTVNGLLPLATTSTWMRPAGPTVFNVPANLWTSNTSLHLRFDVNGSPVNPPTAWFDGITLEPGGTLASGVFSDGFED